MKHMQLTILLPLSVLCALLCGALLYLGYYELAGIGALLTAALLAVSATMLKRHERALNEQMDRSLLDNASAAARLIAVVNIPCMVFHEDGRIVWRNAAMQKLYAGPTIRDLPQAAQPNGPVKAAAMDFAGGVYQVLNVQVERNHGGAALTFQYWADRSEAEHYKRLYEEQMPYVALIYVDNYEDLSADLQFHRNTVLGEVERLVSETANNIDGIYRRYESGRFLLVFEAQHLAELEKNRFALLEQAHRIETGTAQTVTLSIAVGAAMRVKEADSDARHAMELALGRGGDQAVVKTGTNYAFYGGRRQLESSQSRVRARLFAKALRQLMENTGDVYIMGHKNPDMDCIGASLGVVRCALQAGCRPFVVLEESNPTIEHAIAHVRTNPIYAGVLISPETARVSIRPNAVLVIVDTQRASNTMSPELLGAFTGKVVLIDHHRRSADYIDNSTLNFLEVRASSTCEMVTETMQYFHESIRPTAFECSAMLAGITLDTKQFAFNVGARTFEAAAYLRQHGADIGAVKLMFQDDRQTYADRVDTVKSATIFYPGVAISLCRENMENAPLIAAQAADALVGIRGIEAAFVLAHTGNGVNISGRSLGRVNVQMILEKLGGGGHLTMAGAQVDKKAMGECVDWLKREAVAYMEALDGSDGRKPGKTGN